MLLIYVFKFMKTSKNTLCGYVSLFSIPILYTTKYGYKKFVLDVKLINQNQIIIRITICKPVAKLELLTLRVFM